MVFVLSVLLWWGAVSTGAGGGTAVHVVCHAVVPQYEQPNSNLQGELHLHHENMINLNPAFTAAVYLNYFVCAGLLWVGNFLLQFKMYVKKILCCTVLFIWLWLLYIYIYFIYFILIVKSKYTHHGYEFHVHLVFFNHVFELLSGWMMI